MADIENLKKKVQKIAAITEFYGKLEKRKPASHKELDDLNSKKEFSKKQILSLCMECKSIIRESSRDIMKAGKKADMGAGINAGKSKNTGKKAKASKG